MTAHDALIVAIKTHEPIAAMIGDRMYASTSLGREGVPDARTITTPWMAWNELPATNHEIVRKRSKAKTRTYQLFVYDDLGFYSKINTLLDLAEDVVAGFAPIRTASGLTIMESSWSGLSGNLEDEDYGCSVRFGTASLVCSS